MQSLPWHTFKTQQINIGVPQGRVLSATLFSIYTSDIPLPRKTYKSQHMLMTYTKSDVVTNTMTLKTRAYSL